MLIIQQTQLCYEQVLISLYYLLQCLLVIKTTSVPGRTRDSNIMTSYHDLEEQTYQTVKASPLTRIHGKPSWRAKETLKNEAKKIAIALKVTISSRLSLPSLQIV